MKLKRFCLLLLLLLIFSTNVIEVNALNTGFSTEEISEEKKDKFVSNIDVSLLSTEPVKKAIQCFDVNEQGLIAVCQQDTRGKEVCIYTSQGDFLYGYTFNCTQSFGVEWDEQHVNIYFDRSGMIVSLDLEGNVLDVKSIQSTVDNSIYRQSLRSTTRVVGDTKYLIRNDMGLFNLLSTSFSQIVIIDSTGTDSIIYDVNSMQLTKMITIFIIVCVFIFSFVAGYCRKFTKFRRSA